MLKIVAGKDYDGERHRDLELDELETKSPVYEETRDEWLGFLLVFFAPAIVLVGVIVFAAVIGVGGKH